MKIFSSTAHLAHYPRWYLADGITRPCPEIPARVEAIQLALAQPLTPSLAIDPLPVIAAVHAPDYLHYLRTIHPIWHAEFHCDVLPDTFPPRTRAARPAKPSAQAGWYCFDTAAPITAGTYEAALESARLATSAASAILSGDRAAYALCRPPGHHAGPDYCGGFCYLNNIAIAAQHLLLHGKTKIAILDLDYHHGNGTQDIFYHRNDVLFISLHADPNTQYPYFWGYPQERGTGPGEGFNLNLPLPRGASSSDWFNALELALFRLRQFAPEALLISLGVDTHETDTVGDFKLTHNDFLTVGKKLAALNLPTAFVQEGGYNLQTLGACVAAVLHGFES